MGLIYVDACLLIYAFERHSRHAGAVQKLLARAQAAYELAVNVIDRQRTVP